MTVLVRYVQFHPDNYQGGSGKSFEFTTVVEIPDSTLVSDVWQVIHARLTDKYAMQSPFQVPNHGPSYAIQSAEIL